MLKKIYRSLPLLLLLLPAANAQTITREDQVNLYAPTVSGETGLFTTIVGDTLRRGDWSFGIYYSNYDYLVGPARDLAPRSRRSYRDMDVDENRLSASIGVGITDRWEVTASLPYVSLRNNAGDEAGFINGFPYVGKFHDSGIGNLHLATKVNFLDPNVSAARFALSFFVDAPTGDHDGGITSGNTDYGVGAHWNRGIFSFSGIYKLTGNRDVKNEPSGFDFNRFDIPNEAHFDAGLNIPLGFWPTTNWVNEINTVFYQGGDRRPDDPIYIVTGIRHWFGTSGWALNAGVRSNVTMWQSKNNSCPIGGLFGLTFAPSHLAAALPPPPAPVPVPPPAPEPAPVQPPPEPVAPPKGPTELRTDEIHFEPGSARLTNIAKAILDDVALRMRQEPASTAIVIGYNDDREATGANKDLDRRRAEAVRDYLVSRHGIDASRISVEGRDGQDPIGDNTTAEGRLRNRRVVIRLLIP
ncbi:MAG TPA: OmpA family protein [Thermoanaerobaculia bacterium]|nr:OmpA family protein [Thermoanaerobaculia bacterium]